MLPRTTVKYLAHFNSIKVRLELYPLTYKAIFARLFQFHKGTIRTSF